MRHPLSLAVLAVALLAACGGATQTRTAPAASASASAAPAAPAALRLASCDDGGSGGVLIGDVCL